MMCYLVFRCSVCGFCFFKQKTAYEMRISDWSSDVCSSDLYRRHGVVPRKGAVRCFCERQGRRARPVAKSRSRDRPEGRPCRASRHRRRHSRRPAAGCPRSEERRVRQECVSTCRSQCARSPLTKNKNKKKTHKHTAEQPTLN